MVRRAGSETISGYSSGKVKKALWDAIMQPCVETTCHWIAELVCSGRADIVWDTFIESACRTISVSSPKVVVYLDAKLAEFKRAVAELPDNQIHTSNRAKETLFEIGAVLCQARRHRRIDRVKVDEKSCFLVPNIKSRCWDIPTRTMESGDPVELAIPLSQLEHALSTGTEDVAHALYWLEWCIAYAKCAKRSKHVCSCATRPRKGVDARYHKDLAWLIWNTLASAAKSPLSSRVISSYVELFSSRYIQSSLTTRWYVFYAAIETLVTKPDVSTVLVRDPDVIQIAKAHVDKVYAQILPKPENDIRSQSMSSSQVRSAEKLVLLRQAEHYPRQGQS